MNANTGKPVIEPLDGGPLPSLKGYHMPLGRTPLGGYGGSTVVANNNNNNNNSKSNSNNSTHSGNNNSTNLNISSSNNSSGRVGVGPQPRLKPSSYHHPRSVPRGNVRVAPFPPDDRLPHSPLSGGNSRTGSTNPRGRLPPHGHNNNTTTVTFTSRRTAASEVAAPGPLMANTGRSSKDGRGLVNSASASATMNATNASNSTTRNCTLPSLPPPSVTSAETQGTTLYGESNASNSPLTMYSSTTVATTPHHHNTHKLANSQHQQQPTASAAATYSLHNLSRYEEEEVRQFLPEVYFTGLPKDKKVAADKSIPKNCGFDDENDHYVIHNGDHIAYRYEIVKELGRGTFGVVVRAIDHKTKQQVAIKIVKNRTAYTKQAKEEASFLERLVRDDPEDSQNIVRLVQTLMFRDHYILVFELLDKDVYRVIQINKYRPMQMSYIFDFADQVLTALRFIASHRIIHCDIKPENIVMDSTNPSLTSSQPRLKIIDFGSSCNEDNRVFTYIQSRYYRAPEIVLGIPYTTAIDMWSFGCVLCELANGYPIFPASSEGELLERMTEYFGDFPDHLVRQGKRASKFFSLGDQCAMLPNLSRKGRRCHGAHARRLTHFLKSSFSERDGLFADFVGRCLKYDPTQRMTAVEAMKHPWIVRGRSPYQ